MPFVNNWLVIQAKDSHYADIEGHCYEYPKYIQNAQRVRPGDILVIVLPKRDAPDERRILGIAHIGQIRKAKDGLFIAYYDRYKALRTAATFEEIGGDPRGNPRMSINKINPEVVDKLLKREGLSSIEEVPEITVQMEEREIPPEHELREDFHKAVVDDLLGPAGGQEEEIVGTSARDRYLVGKLAPKKVSADAAASEDRNRGGDVRTEDGDPDEGESAHESLMPSSFGMTFCVDTKVRSLKVEASWGRYERVDSELVVDLDGKPKKAWKRSPAGGKVDLPLSSSGAFGPLVPDPKQEGVFLRGLVRDPGPSGERIVTLFLVNEQEEPEANKDAAWLFQPEVIVRSPDDSAVFRLRPTGEIDPQDEERAALAMLYRDQVEFAVGHGVSVHATVAEGMTDRAVEIRTKVIPFFDVPKTEVPTPEDIPGISDIVLDMKEAAELEKEVLIRSLRVLKDEYATWIDHQNSRIVAGELAGFQTQAREALGRCESVKERLEEGICVLEEDAQALDAFRFANKAMWLQRVRSIYALRRRRGEQANLGEIDQPENRSWYPFQLAFILLAIPSLANPMHPERTETGAAIADLLWFPTGGGKTEAYLGLAAFAIAIRRLQGQVGGLDGTRGVAVIMRYTLRLLTIQQFQRASTLMCAMEVLRQGNEQQWGKTPFRLGLWVGQRATPNITKDAEDAIQNAHGDSWIRRGTGTPQQLTSCPWCGSKIDMGKGDLKCLPFAANVGRTLTFCSDKYGRCEFSPAKSPDEGIPVIVVDEEIYRLLPAMIVGTVDKFAQMPWKGEVQTLFGRVSGECPRHGFVSPDSEEKCSGNHHRSGALPRTQRQDCLPLRPPDLIIQDEFHLISGPLGTLVGLYETAVDELATWTFEERRIHPKVVASTATIRKASEQTHGVFLRHVNVFPPHGLDVADNFFSVQRKVSKEKPGRRYMGVCAPGISRPAVLIRVYTAFLTAAQRLRELYGVAADPWMTLVGYFNSLRELGGMRRLVEDDVTTRAFRVTLGDLERPGLAQRDIRVVEELTSRASSTDIPRILDRLEDRFPELGQKPNRTPIDVLLATNMLSVGVDVQRLGLMVVNGQPKTTAEYIQATSRVGRRYPGLICTVLNWSRPRDLSHYETFEHYHATFYQHVEAQSVTPFAPRAVDRGLTGVLASLIRLRDLDLNANCGAGHLTSTTDTHATTAVADITARGWNVTEKAEIRDLVAQALGQRVDEWVDETGQGGRNLGYRGEKDGSTVGLLKPPGPHPWGIFTTPTSMREVEPPVSLILKTDMGCTGAGWEAPKRDSTERGGDT